MSSRKPISPTSSTGSSISGPPRASTNSCRGHGPKPTPPIDSPPDARRLKFSRQLQRAVGRKGRLPCTHLLVGSSFHGGSGQLAFGAGIDAPLDFSDRRQNLGESRRVAKDHRPGFVVITPTRDRQLFRNAECILINVPAAPASEACPTNLAKSQPNRLLAPRLVSILSKSLDQPTEVAARRAIRLFQPRPEWAPPSLTR